MILGDRGDHVEIGPQDSLIVGFLLSWRIYFSGDVFIYPYLCDCFVCTEATAAQNSATYKTVRSITSHKKDVSLTLLNLAKGYSFPSSVTRLQWWNTAPSDLAGLVNGIHSHGRTCFRPSLAFTCLYPWLVSLGVIPGGPLQPWEARSMNHFFATTLELRVVA